MTWSSWLRKKLKLDEAEHLRRGRLGERAAKRHLKSAGLKFLTANFKGKHGEIDLIFRDADCLVFVEVKTRSSEAWTRPAAAVNTAKKLRIISTSKAYLKQLANRNVKYRYDIVEVLWGDDGPSEIRHLTNAFEPSRMRR